MTIYTTKTLNQTKTRKDNKLNCAHIPTLSRNSNSTVCPKRDGKLIMVSILIPKGLK